MVQPRVVLAEPALYIFGESPIDAYERFETFWSEFERLELLVKFNDLRLALTDVLLDATQTLFPGQIPAHSGAAPAEFREMQSRAWRFLESFSRRPLWEFADMAETLVCDPALNRKGVYLNDDVWLSWQDLIAGFVKELQSGIQAGLFQGARVISAIFCAHDSLSAMPTPAVELSCRLPPAQEPLPLALCWCPRRDWPRGLIDPEHIRALEARRSPGKVQMAYEDSGHLPSPVLQKVLERTANDLASFIVRMGTSRMEGRAQTCKLMEGEQPHDLFFRVCDGKVTFRGYFQTTAKNQEEQKSALTLVERAFQKRCLESRLEYER